MTLLIGSIYANGSTSDLEWLQIQKYFIESTTKDYHLVGVVPNPVRNCTIHNNIDIIGESYQVAEPVDYHMLGLRAIKAYFEENQDKFDRLLILDSDAFPIRKEWQQHLESAMTHLVEYCEIACPIRCELLELRLHASILYARSEALPYLEFKNGYFNGRHTPRRCLLTAWNDRGIFLPHYETTRRIFVLPLLKSNQYTDGLLTGSIYYDLFYHHGAGSRRRQTRARAYWMPTSDMEYWRHKAVEDGKE